VRLFHDHGPSGTDQDTLVRDRLIQTGKKPKRKHYERAGLVLEACSWYLTAATWAMVNDQPATISQLDRVTALDHDLPGGPRSDLLRATARVLLLSIGWRVGSDLRHMRELYAQSVAAATRAHDDRLLAIAQISLGGCVMKNGGYFDEGAELFTTALHTAQRTGDPGLLATAHTCVSYSYCYVGRLRDGLDAADAALELTTDQPELNAGGSVLESPRGLAQLCRAFLFAALGSISEALAVLEDNEAFVRDHGYHETLCWHAAVTTRYCAPQAPQWMTWGSHTKHKRLPNQWVGKKSKPSPRPCRAPRISRRVSRSKPPKPPNVPSP